MHTHEVSLKEYFSKIHPSFRACVEKAFDDLCNGKIKKVRKEYCLERLIPGEDRHEWEEIQMCIRDRILDATVRLSDILSGSRVFSVALRVSF